MFGIHHYSVFLLAGILLNLTPGQDTFYILGRAIAQGPAAGYASVFGISCGALVHTFAAALGLSALLYASASAFLIVKYAGAAYLFYLGLRMLLSRGSGLTPDGGSPQNPASARKIFLQGLLTNLLNPKVALFFLALMPQFISAESEHKTAAFLLLGLSFVTTGTIWCLCLVWFSNQISDKIRRRPSVGKLLNRAAGALFLWLGIRLACIDR